MTDEPRDKLYDDLCAALAGSPALSVSTKLRVLSTVMLTIALEPGELGPGVAQVCEAVDRSITSLLARYGELSRH